jgi:hypothetical protein
VERTLDRPRKVVGVIDLVDLLAERILDVVLFRILVEVDLLMRMPAEVVGRHVARDDDHRDRVRVALATPVAALVSPAPVRRTLGLQMRA